MAIVPMQKIQLLVYKDEKPKVVDFLQNKGVLQIIATPVEEEGPLARMDLGEEGHQLEYDVAQLDFAVSFLKKYETKKKGLQAMLDRDAVFTDPEAVEKITHQFAFKEVVSRCESVEEELIALHNEKKALKARAEKLYPWSQLPSALDAPRETEHVESIFLVISVKEWEEFRSKIFAISKLIVLECDSIYNTKVHAHLIVDKSLVTEVNGVMTTYKAERAELPEAEGKVTDELERIEKRISKIEEREGQLNTAAGELSKDLKKLRILYDATNWKRLQKQERRKFVSTGSVVLVSGWMPKKSIEPIRTELKKITQNFELIEIEPEEGEDPPVLLRNKSFMRPFQAVTNIYGLPLPNELDPTPYLAAFFILFFGLCLSDAIYGLLMFAIMWSVLHYLNIPKKSQNLIRLLMYGGLVTFFIGALFGGWASLTPEQVPSWLTSQDPEGNKIFVFQKISAITNPLGVLILSLVLGYIQVLVGVIMNFVWKFRHENKLYAMIDHFPWVYILSVIGLWIMVRADVLPESLNTPVLYLLGTATLLIILTQGREKKNIILKFLSGVLGLYGLVGYLSDVLSYSRLLALGLATSIIGLAVNTIAGMVNGVPYIGILLALIVLVVGHVFNLGINALGAFIHAGRLQFVEFFTKFLEGGGRAFDPLRKESRFIRFRDIA